MADQEPQCNLVVQQPVCKVCSETSWEKYTLHPPDTHNAWKSVFILGFLQVLFDMQLVTN